MLWDSEEEALEQIKKGIAIADVLKVSEEEAQLITGDKDPANASQKLLSMGPALVLVSLGELGAYYRNHVCYSDDCEELKSALKAFSEM